MYVFSCAVVSVCMLCDMSYAGWPLMLLLEVVCGDAEDQMVGLDRATLECGKGMHNLELLVSGAGRRRGRCRGRGSGIIGKWSLRMGSTRFRDYNGMSGFSMRIILT